MVFGKAKGSRALVASLLCATALGCVQDPEEQASPGYQQQGTVGGQPGQVGNPAVTGTTGTTVPVGTTGTTGAPGVVTTPPGTGTTGTTTPVQPTGPVDLGANSQGDTFFRAYTMELVKPRVWVNIPVWGLSDETAQVQGFVNGMLVNDGNMDGLVDVSLLVRFLQTGNPSAANGQVTIGGGRCPMPLGPQNACGAEPVFPFQSPAVGYSNAQNCMLEGTTEVAVGSCFVSAKASLTINVPLLGPVALQDGQVIGTWQNGEIIGGRVRGFLSKSVALATKLPPEVKAFPELVVVDVVEGRPLSNYLDQKPASMGGELTVGPSGEEGWWFMLNFTAKPATFNPALTQ